MIRRYRVPALVALLAVGVAAAAPAQTPKTAGQVFLEYRAVFEKAKAIDEILPFMGKNVTAQIMKTPPAERKQMFEMMQMMSDARGVRVLKETPNPQGVELSVEGTTPEKKKSTGTIQMVKEGGAWKIDKEKWQ